MVTVVSKRCVVSGGRCGRCGRCGWWEPLEGGTTDYDQGGCRLSNVNKDKVKRRSRGRQEGEFW